MTEVLIPTNLPAQRGGAKALLLTVFGEFVLPAGGEVWTSSLVAAAAALDIGEKNARQAIARIADQGLIEGSRHGRAVRWSLTTEGRRLLESGAERIYGFGTRPLDWNGTWLIAHCPVAESQRVLRNHLRTQLGFLGFGELSASLVVSPHTEREPELRRVLAGLDLLADSTVLRSTTAGHADDVDLVERAWDLDTLAASYRAFSRAQLAETASEKHDQFRSLVSLVHDWRRFPFSDPELPSELLPDDWAGAAAGRVFHERHAAWSAAAQDWFETLEDSQRAAS